MFSGAASYWALAYVVSEWLIRVVMVVIVPFRRSPDAARSWLLLVLFLPWPALLLYILIGKATYPRWRRARIAELPALQQANSRHILGSTSVANERLPRKYVRTAALVQRIGHLPVVDGNTVELLTDYEATVARLVADIDSAGAHVHLLFYIFADDSVGSSVIAALARAAGRGIDCRVLIDAVGSRPWAKSVLSQLRHSGVSAHLALPITFLRRKSARADLRNHRKIAIIDGTIGYTGSQNIVERESSPGLVNQELMLRLCGPVVDELQAVFMADWFMETDEELAAPLFMRRGMPIGTAHAQTLPTGPDYSDAGVESLMVTAIHSALEHVTLVTPYFVPTEPLMIALKTAVLRGVKVELVVPKIVDQFLVRLAQQSHYGRLMEAGIEVRLYLDKFLHAKTAAIDHDLAIIGSSNMDIRSFLLNCEVTVAIYDRDVTRALRAEQARWLTNSEPLVAERWARRRLPIRIVENMARLMGPLL